MSDTLERMQERARELARSGQFSGWRSVVFELQFEPCLKGVFQWLHNSSVQDAFQLLHSPATKKELDRLATLLHAANLKLTEVAQGLRSSAWIGKFCVNWLRPNRLPVPAS